MANFYGQYVGFGAGGVEVPSSHAAGNINSYQAGGNSALNYITMFTFASLGNTTDVADLATGVHSGGGHSSATHGFTSGYTDNGDTINKYSFPNASTSVDHGDLNSGAYLCGGSGSLTQGFTMGGAANDTIQRFSYSSNTTGTDVGNLTGGRRTGPNSATSSTHCYVMGGCEPSRTSVEKISHSSDENSTDVGDVNVSSGVCGSHANDLTHCYVAGGGESPRTKNIDRMAFAVEGTVTGVGDLSRTDQWGSGTSSKAGYGYIAGGVKTGGISWDIDQYQMAASTSGSDVGDLVAPRGTGSYDAQNMAGAQY